MSTGTHKTAPAAVESWTSYLHFLQSETRLSLIARAAFSADVATAELTDSSAEAIKGDLTRHFWWTFYGEAILKADALRDVLAAKGLLDGDIADAMVNLQQELGDVYSKIHALPTRTIPLDPLRAAVLEATL